MLQLHVLVCVLVVLLVPALLPAATPIPGGVLDPGGRAAYFSGDTGIDAVELARGELLWRTKDAQVPLCVTGDRLFALALSDHNVLHVSGFDLADRGKRVYQSAAVEFPRWVVTGEVPGRSFHYTWLQHKNVLDIAWQAGAWAESGPRKQAAGEVRVDLEKGTVKMGPVGSQPAPAAPAMPTPLVNLSVRWQRSIGGHLHALVLEEAPAETGERKQRLVFRTWDERTGKAGPSHDLLRGSRPVALADPSGLHLWLRDAAPSPDEVVTENSSRSSHNWTVWSVLDGHLVAHVPFVLGTLKATLIGERAYCLVSAPERGGSGSSKFRRRYTIHAIDIGSGRTLWQRTLSSKALVP
jgi:hypothetical protein